MSESTADSTRVAVVLNRDLMFGSRIRHALAGLGLEARFCGNTDAFIAALFEWRESSTLGIIDMNGPVTWDALREALTNDEGLPPTLAFGPHVDAENRRAAKAAGITRVVSNGQFHREAQALIERYRRH